MTVNEFNKQEKRVLKNLENVKKGFTKKSLAEDIFDLEDESDIFATNSLTAYFFVYRKGAEEALRKIYSREQFKVTQEIRATIKRRAQEFFGEEVNKTTLKELEKTISEGIIAGDGADKIADRVKAVYTKARTSRAETIARTEALTTLNEAQYNVYENDKTVEGVQWVATLDNRTRDSHRALHGIVVKKGDKFNLGGRMISRPMDSGLPAAEVINCRCSLIAVVKN